MADSTSNKIRSIDKVYNFLVDYIRTNGLSPSVRDICNGTGLKSTSSVHYYLKQLDEQNKIKYRPGLRRAILINNDDRNSSYEESTDNDTVVTPIDNTNSNMTKLPCLGKITAGLPIYAFEDNTESYYVPTSLVGNNECFMLRVTGNSMINAHILDGDVIIVRKQNSCDNGDIIVGLIDNEATVKRFGYKNDIPYLFPENESYSPIPFNTSDCKILGKVIGLHRYSIN